MILLALHGVGRPMKLPMPESAGYRLCKSLLLAQEWIFKIQRLCCSASQAVRETCSICRYNHKVDSLFYYYHNVRYNIDITFYQSFICRLFGSCKPNSLRWRISMVLVELCSIKYMLLDFKRKYLRADKITGKLDCHSSLVQRDGKCSRSRSG